MKTEEKKAIKKLLKDLEKMRETENFIKLGLGKGGKNHKWLEKLNEIKQNEFISVNALITVKYLHMLALQYALHAGKITSYSIELKQEITENLK